MSSVIDFGTRWHNDFLCWTNLFELIAAMPLKVWRRACSGYNDVEQLGHLSAHGKYTGYVGVNIMRCTQDCL